MGSFEPFSDLSKLVLTAEMYLGRLEIIPRAGAVRAQLLARVIGRGTVRPIADSRARDRVAQARARVERELAELEGPVAVEEGDSGQQAADMGTETFQTELDESLAIRLRDELAAVERAEQRLEEGTYGLSIESGEPIPDGRLELIPWAERTAEERRARARGLNARGAHIVQMSLT